MCFYMFPHFKYCGEGIVKSVRGENQGHNYHTKLAIPTLIPSSIISNHNGTRDQTAWIKPSSDTQTTINASSEQANRAIGYQSNNGTTVKILNASLRESNRTKHSIYIRQRESFTGITRDITTLFFLYKNQ